MALRLRRHRHRSGRGYSSLAVAVVVFIQSTRSTMAAFAARELHPDLLALEVARILPASPEGEGGVEVLRVDAPRVLILGGLWDADAERQLPFAAPHPERFWHVTWAFVLEPLDEH